MNDRLVGSLRTLMGLGIALGLVTTGPCPDFASGALNFFPDGKARQAQIWISDAAKKLHGPVVFGWHGTGGQPTEAFTQSEIDAITAVGGILVAPFSMLDASQYHWYLVYANGKEDDLRLADEVVACAIQKVGIDLRRIHSIGFSAGALIPKLD